MPDITLEDVVARLEIVEKQLTEQQAERKKDWRRTVGMFDDDPDFTREVIAESQAIREAEREAARRGESE